MADRYWVGGTGTWDGTSTTNWSASSGGASGASVPTAADNVFFDANSNTGTGAFTVTMATSPRVCNDITISGLDGAMTLAGSAIGLTVSGSLSFPATNFTPTYTGTTTFSTANTGKTITSNGVAFPGSITFIGGGAWQLQDALTTPAINAVTLTSGSLDLNNKTLTCGQFASSNSNTRSVAFGTTGSIVLVHTTAGVTVLGMQQVTNFSFTGTSNISAAMSVTRTFAFGSTSGSNPTRVLNINLTSGASVPTFTGFFRQIDFTGSTCNPGLVTIDCHGFKLASGGTYTSTTFNLSFGGSCTFTGKQVSALTIDNAGGTTTLLDAGSVSATTTLTQGTLDLTNVTLTTNSFSSDNSNTRSIAFGTTGSIVVTGTTTALAMATATGFTFTGTSNISAAMSTGRTFNFGGTAGATTSNRLNVNLTSGASAPVFTGSFRQINFTGTTSTYGGVANCHGFTLASGGTYTSASFTTVGDGTITYTGKSISALNINAAGITTTLASAGQNATTTLTNGTLNLAGFTLTSTTTATTAAGTKNLTFNGGTLVCSAATTTAWNNAAPTNFTTTAGTGTGIISMTAATAKTFVGGGSTYNCTLNQGGAGTLTITGANTFNDITNTNATASQITFPASTTTTVNAFTLSGSSGNLVSLRSSTSGTRFTLSDASGTVSVSFLNIQDSNATGGATWRSFTTNGNVDSGNNLGWVFSGFIDGIAVITCDATVVGIASVNKSFIADITANATVNALGYRVEHFSADITADANVSANGFRLKTFIADISAAATVDALGYRIKAFTGDITANAIVDAIAYSVKSFAGDILATGTVVIDATRIRTSVGDITGNATVIALPNIRASGVAFINSYADVSAYANVRYSGLGIINATADVVANGKIVGEEWGDTTPTSSTWTTSSPEVSSWSNIAGTSSTWLRQ